MKSIGNYLRVRHSSAPKGLREENLRKVRTYLASNNLSTIPSMLTRIDALCRDQNIGVDAFAEVYQMDKASSARLVRTANSVEYASRQISPVIGIRAAILQVGFNKAREILHAAIVCGLYKAHLSIADYSAVELWKHSMAVALATRMIFNTIIKDSNPPADPYLAGLLHDLGISIEHACLYHDGFSAAITAKHEEKTDLIFQERQMIGLTHPEVGLELARIWNFPPGLTAAIEFHHDPDKAPEKVRVLLHAIRAAEWLCLSAGIGYSDLAESEKPEYIVSLKQVGINEEAIENLKVGITAEFGSLNDMGWFSGLQLKR